MTCEAYSRTGFCSKYLAPLGAEIIVNYSRAPSQDVYSATADAIGGVLGTIAHQKCLDLILPFLCRYVFVTCDPAYNTSIHQVYQPLCRHGCNVVSLFACPVVWRLLEQQLAMLKFDILDPLSCDLLGDPNGGDAPDCIDTTDGGKPL